MVENLVDCGSSGGPHKIVSEVLEMAQEVDLGPV